MTAARSVSLWLLFGLLLLPLQAWVVVWPIASKKRHSLLHEFSLFAENKNKDDNTNTNNSLIDDGTGHVRSELAASIWNWDHEHRLHDKQKEEKFPFSTRAGLRWVDEIAKHLLETLDESAGSASSTSSSSQALAQDSSAASYSDLIQEGVVALLYVMSHYQEHIEEEDAGSSISQDEAQHSFETYARRYIAERMRMSLATDARPIKIPKRVQSLLRHARRVRQELLEQQNGTEPTVAQVAARLGVPPEKLELYQLVSVGTLSMERTVEIYDPRLDARATFADQDTWESQNHNVDEEQELVDDEGDDEMWVHREQIAAPLKELIPDYDTPDKHLLQETMYRDVQDFLVRTLTDVEVQVIRMRFGLHPGSAGSKPRSCADIADALQMTAASVREVERQALEKLKLSTNTQSLEPYLQDEHDNTIEDSF